MTDQLCRGVVTLTRRSSRYMPHVAYAESGSVRSQSLTAPTNLGNCNFTPSREAYCNMRFNSTTPVFTLSNLAIFTLNCYHLSTAGRSTNRVVDAADESQIH